MSLDSLIGFLPYRNLATKWKFLAFETWLRRKGGDPSLYKQSLGLEDGYEVHDSSIEPESISVSEVAGEDQESLPSKPKIRIFFGHTTKRNPNFYLHLLVKYASAFIVLSYHSVAFILL